MCLMSPEALHGWVIVGNWASNTFVGLRGSSEGLREGKTPCTLSW